MVTHPEIALKPDVSLVVIVHGMAKGVFTGKKLGDYITDFDRKDYINARRIVNGLDRATEIAAFATFWEGALSGINTIGSDPAPTARYLPHLGEINNECPR
jgi:putative chitinase